MSQKKGIGIFLAAALIAVVMLFGLAGTLDSDTAYINLPEQEKMESQDTIKAERISVPDEKNQETDTLLNRDEKSEEDSVLTVKAENSGEQNKVVCYVCGKVKRAGTYELLEGCRWSDFIEAAGGFSRQAAKEYLNLARKAEDGQRIYVPSKKQVKKWKKSGAESGSSLEDSTENENVFKNSSGSLQGQEPGSGKININTAEKEELMLLAGIGEAKADAIIHYRETNGAFHATEELMQISGIKEGVYQKICDYITI